MAARWVFLAALLAAVGAGMAVPLPEVLYMTRLSHLLQLGHFVGFAAVAVCAAWAFSGRWAAALVVALVVAAAFEAGQGVVGRTPALVDFGRSALGAVAGVALWVAGGSLRRPGRLAGSLLIVVAVSAWPLAAHVPYLVDTWREVRSFPVLCDFRSARETARWHTSGVEVTRHRHAHSPEGWMGRFYLPPGGRGPMAILRPVVQDWRGYRQLRCELTVDGPAMPVTIVLETRRGGRKVHTELLRSSYGPGTHSVEADLRPPLRPGRTGAELSRVTGVFFRFPASDRPRTLSIGSVRLQ